jgi:hypothetical protein
MANDVEKWKKTHENCVFRVGHENLVELLGGGAPVRLVILFLEPILRISFGSNLRMKLTWGRIYVKFSIIYI